MLRILALLCIMVATVRPAYAESPRVVTDIAPVHSLVAMVMQGIGEPEVLMPPGTSPHDFALRPSDARNLAQADVVVWIGEALTPGLARSIASLAGSARSVELLEAPGTFHLAYRSGAVFGHDHHDRHKHDKAHKDPARHGDHTDHKHHDDHAEHGAHEDHKHHGDMDPHAWQDPENAKVWLEVIANTLSSIDPGNATAYRANASASAMQIDDLVAALRTQLAPLTGRGFVVTHDAFHHFEHRFGIEAVAAISPGDASQASAARLQEVSRMLAADAPICIFIEPQMSETLAQTFADEHGAKVGVIDPVGATLAPGPGLYPALLQGIANGLGDCLR